MHATCASPMQETLLKEQRAIMELFLKVVYQILSPVQAAIFVVNSFPYHCDVLALANVLSSMFGKEGTGPGTSGAGGQAAGGPTHSGPTGGGGGAGPGGLPFGGGPTRASMEQGMGMQLGSRGSLKVGGAGALQGGGLQAGGMGLGGPAGLAPMQVQSHMGSSAAGNGVGASHVRGRIA